MKNFARSTLVNAVWPYALLALAAALAYHNIFPNGFLFDDEFLLVKNDYLRSWKHLGDIFISSTTAGFGGTDSFYRPLQIFAYWLVTQLFGFSETSFHALNLTLHAANACLMFALAKKLRFQPIAALIASVLWAVHPIHTEAVTYMSATADTLSTLFILLTLLAWDGEERGKKITAGVCFVLALLSKETAIIAPALLILVLTVRDGWDRQRILKIWPLWLIAAIYLLLRLTLFNFNNDFNFYKAENIYTGSIFVRFCSFLATLPDYIQTLILPFDLHMERPSKVYTTLFMLQPLIGLAIVVSAGALIIFSFKRRDNPVLRVLGFGAAWFFVSYFPCSGIIIPVNAIFLEHWMYLPIMGVFLALGEVLATPLKGETARITGLIVVGVLGFTLLLVTWKQNEVWRNPFSFYGHILQFEEGSARLHNNLAMAYTDIERDDLAFAHYQKAIALEDRYAQTHYNLGRLYLKQGRTAEGAAEMKRALEIDPKFERATQILQQLKAD